MSASATVLSWIHFRPSFTKVVNDDVNWWARRSFCNPRPQLTEVTAYTAKFLSWILLSPFRWAIEHFKIGTAYEIQPLFTRKPKFLLDTSFCGERLVTRYLHFHTDYHTVFFSLQESSNHRKHHQPKQLGRRSLQMGSARANAVTKNFSGKCREKQCVRPETPSVPR